MRPHPAITVLFAACHAAPVAPRPIPAAACDTARVGAVVVTGAPRTAVPALTVLEGTLDDAPRAVRVAAAAIEALQWRGYAQARIAVTRLAACFTDLHVAVTLGPKYRIAGITFDTTDELPPAQRLAALEDALGTVNTVGGVLIEYRLHRALEGLARRYRDAGWLDVAIGTPVTRYGERGDVRLTIPIVAGARYRVAAIRALGASATVRARLLETLGIAPGDWYDGPAIRRAIARARRSLDRRIALTASLDTARREIELEATVERRR